MAITAGMVKELREKTGVGMMDCKNALTETGGDMEAAVDWLRAKGLAKAAKKAGRVAAEGLVGVATAPGKAVMVEVNSETDFVARNADFQNLVTRIADGRALDRRQPRRDQRGKAQGRGDRRRGAEGRHRDDRRERDAPPLGDGLGQAGRGRDLCPQCGCPGPRQDRCHRRPRSLPATRTSSPRSGGRWRCTSPRQARLRVREEEVDPAVLARERAVFTEQAKDSGKPDSIIAKMVEGRIRKFYEEVVLLAQNFVVDSEKTVGKAVAAAEAEVGAPIKVTEFIVFRLGEGVEKAESDFAAEVAGGGGRREARDRQGVT